MADTQIYGTMCTDVGNAAIANSVLTGTKVNFTQIAVGDANGTPYVPVSGMTALKHQVWSGPIGEVAQDTMQANRMILHAVLPSSVGGWVMREIGVLDDKGNLIAVGNTPEIPKEAITSGTIMEMDLCIYISVIDARGVNVVIDPTVVIASKADVNQLRQLLEDHKGDKNNPHSVTAAQVGAIPSAILHSPTEGGGTYGSGIDLDNESRAGIHIYWSDFHSVLHAPPNAYFGDASMNVYTDATSTKAQCVQVLTLATGVYYRKADYNGAYPEWTRIGAYADNAAFASNSVALETPGLRNIAITNNAPSNTSALWMW